ncbi:MAG: C2H2-type zinc finger protein [Bacteroidota bacterium]
MNINQIIAFIVPLLLSTTLFASDRNHSMAPIPLSSSSFSYCGTYIPPFNINETPMPAFFFSDVTSQNINNPNESVSYRQPTPPKKFPEEDEESWFQFVAKKDLQCVQYILKKYNFYINMINKVGNTAFLIACQNQDLRMAKYLFEEGADVHAKNVVTGWNALHFSCVHGDKVFTQWLLHLNVNRHALTYNGKRGFDIASMYGHKAFATWLSPELSKEALDDGGNNALALVNTYETRSQYQVNNTSPSFSLQTQSIRTESNIYQQSLPSTTFYINHTFSKPNPPTLYIYNNAFAGNDGNEEKSYPMPLPEFSLQPSNATLSTTTSSLPPSLTPTASISVDDDQSDEPTASNDLVPIPLEQRSKKKFPCLYCPKGYSYQCGLNAHLPSHLDPKSTICHHSNKRFASKTNLQIHLKGAHSKERPYECEFCKKRFKKSKKLERHLPIHHSEKPYFCGICNKRFDQPSILEAHINQVHKKIRPFKCKKCSKAFKRKAHLTGHMKTMHSKKSICKYCNENFETASKLKKHLRIHTGEKVVVCPLCQIPYKNQYTLRAHQKKKHQDVDIYPCESCEKSFETFHQLKRHNRIHTGESSAICPGCNKCFSSPSNRNSHIRRMHKKDARRLFDLVQD